MRTPASTGTDGRVGRLFAVHATASARASRSTRNFMRSLLREGFDSDPEGNSDASPVFDRCIGCELPQRDDGFDLIPEIRTSSSSGLWKLGITRVCPGHGTCGAVDDQCMTRVI